MKNVKINGGWVDIPANPSERKAWLNEIVAYAGVTETLEPTNPIRRFQTITHVRKNGKGHGIPVQK